MISIRSASLVAALLLSASQGHAGSGASQYDPVLPTHVWASASGQVGSYLRFEFQNPQSGLWFDPPMYEGFRISLDVGSFNSITAPDGVNGLQLRAAGKVIDADFSAGETVFFAPGINDFEIRNVKPLIDQGSPVLATVLPLKLSFSAASQMITRMAWDALPAAVPETDIYLMLIAGLGALGFVKRRR